MKLLQILTLTILMISSANAAPGDAPDGPQYQPGTTDSPSSSFAPSGTTSGTALNGNTQVTVPTGGNGYVYGQDASQGPSPGQPASSGGVVGIGTTFK